MEQIVWSAGSMVIDLTVDEHGPVRVRGWSPVAEHGSVTGVGPGVPLVELDCLGGGRLGNSASAQHRPYATGLGLRYVGHGVTAVVGGDRLVVRQRDAAGLAVVTTFQHVWGTDVVRLWHEIANDGLEPVVLTYVSTLSLTGFSGGAGFDGLTIHEARNSWCAELRWQRRSPEQIGVVDNGLRGDDEGGSTSRARHTVTAAGSWSTGGSLPVGAIERAEPATTWAWQVEHCGSWHWEIGDLYQDLYLQVSGPTDAEHQWRAPLAHGERFETVPVAITVTAGGLHEGLRQLTAYRRKIRRACTDNTELPVIFNDYMNCLWGNPTQERLAPLISAAAEVGAEYFVIDAGWYAEIDENWWDTVGAWQPSEGRFPDGLPATLERIRAAGMVPGLWLEPEVIGVRSPVADRLPAEAFFTRGGVRVAENGRYHLDLRSAAAREHLDEVVDRLVGEYGAGYLKLDYNISLAGTDAGGDSPGAGLLRHNRAYLAWLDAVLERHPTLVLENCSSGGMRMDYGLLARLPLQSTSDQSDFLRYATIAAAAPSAVTPEQGAVWAYPLPDQSAEEISFCMVNAALGRVHLSGLIDEMTPDQRDRIRAALGVYRRSRDVIATGAPHWPLGLPGWHDPWVALALAVHDECLVAVWCRDPAGGEVTLRLPGLAGPGWRAEPLFPVDLPCQLGWAPGEFGAPGAPGAPGEFGAAGELCLVVRVPAGPAARLIRVWR